jgi:FemAB-related protein (PEP-CTERM system-associated)
MGVQAAPTLTSAAAPPGDLRVQVCTPADGASWDQFLSAQPLASFYQLYDWTRVNRDTLGHHSHYLIARQGGEVRGVLPLTEVSSALFGRILCSVPFVNYGGPVAADEAAGKSLVAAARQLARERKAKYLELRCRQTLDTDMPVSTRKISMSIPLEADSEALFGKFTTKHRTNIRRSFKNGLEVRGGGRELLPVFYRVMEHSWRSLGTPLYSRGYFESIMATFGDRARIFVCSRGTEPVAVAFNGYYNGTVEGMWAGGTPEARGLQANYALYWDMIKDACERGFSRYHLGRSTAESGAEDFKKKWNAHIEQLYWYFDRPDGGAMPELNVSNPKYQAAIKAWRRLPMPLLRVLGPRIARCIP